MSHFAKILDGKVTQVIVAEQDFFKPFNDATAGDWVQTSYNTYGNQHPEGRPLRGNYAGVGYTYDKENDVFYEPKSYPSWILNESTWLWEAPIAMPTEGVYQWDEATTSWVEILVEE